MVDVVQLEGVGGEVVELVGAGAVGCVVEVVGRGEMMRRAL